MQRLAILFLICLATAASAAPFWGARESSPAVNFSEPRMR